MDEEYSVWKSNPTPSNLSKVMDAVNPTVNAILGSINAADDPTVRTKARALAAKSIKSYDPAYGTSLKTWVNQQLLPLSRYRRKVQGVGLPERTQLDAYALHKGEQELKDKLNRDPDTVELSDYVGMPVKRIREVRSSFRKVVSEENSQPQAIPEQDFTDEAVAYLMPDLDPINRKVLEHRTGFGGAEILDTRALAEKLKISPASVSRKAAYLSGRAEEIIKTLQEVHGL